MEKRSSIQKSVCINENNSTPKSSPLTIGGEHQRDQSLEEIYIV